MSPISQAAFISKFNYLREKRPYLFIAALLVILVVTLLFIPWLLTSLNMNDYLPALIGEVCACAIAVLFLIWLDWWGDLGYTAPLQSQDSHLFAIPILFVVFPALVALLVLVARGSLQVPPADICYFALQALLIAFLEETYYRGFILQALLPRGILLAVFSSALFFTFAHIGSTFSALDGFYICTEILFTFGWGCVFAALWLRTGAIWPLIVMNCLHNFCDLIVHENQGGLAVFVSQTYAWTIWSSLCFALILLGYSFWLLRPLRIQSLHNRYFPLPHDASPPDTPVEPSEYSSPRN
ncbi:MAG TPA: CPBP family intramembrane glutamic endopeptidase [Ktedonobacteraceae bacterium]